jgi:hypothetical protein
MLASMKRSHPRIISANAQRSTSRMLIHAQRRGGILEWP